jgi:hypothetical protein
MCITCVSNSEYRKLEENENNIKYIFCILAKKDLYSTSFVKQVSTILALNFHIAGS